MEKAIVYNQEGKKAGEVTLPEAVFSAKWNGDLVHQVVVSQQANRRAPIAHTKGRGEVSGGGKKPWRQKGTGRARHGSIRSPIWRGGGITFGPTNQTVFARKINRKMKTKALYAVLSKKLADGEVLFVDSLSFDEPKSAKAKGVLMSLAGIPGFEKLSTKRKNTALIALADRDDNVVKSLRNFGNIETEEVRNLNPTDAMQYKYLIITAPEDSLATLAGRGKTEKKAPRKSRSKAK